MVTTLNESDRMVLTIREAARELSISLGTAYSLVAEGKLPSIRISERRVVIPRRALEKMLEVSGKTGEAQS